ncbi:MAG TPA: sulfite exporter TauE/SafE family protein [Acidobacteriaceae bacterium]|nr:sulfite exporter TauE/SafE family protein [Acidobacteriaceae bacterium]
MLIAFVATLVRSTFGFGEAMVAVPLLAFILPLTVATPLAVLLSVTVALIVVVQDHQSIHVRSAMWLLAATLPGLGVGLLLLRAGHQTELKAALGVVILGISAITLSGRMTSHPRFEARGWTVVFGFCAGVLGGAFGMNGPALAIYGALRRWPPQEFRATLQAYFLPASVLGLIGFGAVGIWAPSVTHYYLLSLPVTVPAVFVGRAINRRLRGDSFRKYVFVGLAGIGLLLLARSLRSLF